MAKDQETGEIKSQTFAFKINAVTDEGGAKVVLDSHIQNFLYVLVDPMHWHVTVMAYRW